MILRIVRSRLPSHVLTPTTFQAVLNIFIYVIQVIFLLTQSVWALKGLHGHCAKTSSQIQSRNLVYLREITLETKPILSVADHILALPISEHTFDQRGVKQICQRHAPHNCDKGLVFVTLLWQSWFQWKWKENKRKTVTRGFLVDNHIIIYAITRWRGV